MHQRVLALAREGRSGRQILDQFVREHGIAILMAPPKRGFNLAAYFTPSLLIVAAGVALTLVLRRWVRAAAPAAGTTLVGTAGATPEELARLRRELERLPS